ncbi:MFS transporter [Knoellia subterranea]|uniref:MFS transporter n=1 Tax=Knoellia subterranea KCTC 19937 TaxID=1385521 RepID=A0A0A0JIF2_9MICO|nr:MFS transporter [Knoellia subterranea]KGN37180.1 MFS transporter [Knoellia subterranea KCTC 19937]
MLSTYRPLFDIPGAWRFLAAGALSRVGGAMFGVAIIIMIATRRDSYGLAGAVSAGGIVVLAVAGPLIGRLVDKYGQRRASLPFILGTFGAGLVTVVLSFVGAPAWTLFVGYAVSAFLPEMGPMSRARWAWLLRDEPDALHAAMSLEQVVEEGTFVLGPVIAVTAATMLFPEAGLLLAYITFTAGAVAFLLQARSEPPVVPHDDRPAGLAITRPGVAAVAAAGFMVGAVFGGNEVVSVAVADEAGRTQMSSIILGAFALGSGLSALYFGTRKFTGSLARRFVWCALAMCVLELPVLFIHDLWGIAAMMFIAGSATAPTLITALTLVQQLVPRALITEGMAVVITGLLVGLASATALSGILVDSWGAHATYALPVGAAFLAALIAAASGRQVGRAARAPERLPSRVSPPEPSQ